MATIRYEGGGSVQTVEGVSVSYHDETDSWKFPHGDGLVLVPREHVISVQLDSDEVFSLTE